LPIKKEYDKLNPRYDFLEPKHKDKFEKLRGQEFFLSGMIKNMRCLVELSITDEILKEYYIQEVDKLMFIKDNKFRSSLIPAQTEFLLSHYNKLKGELNETL